MTPLRKLAAAALLLASAHLIAEETESAPEPGAKRDRIEELTVIAHPLSGEGLSQPATVLAGDDLERRRQGSIGATVGAEPGIHSATFGAAVGRPVIHGLSGARVRIMEDRIDAMDASVLSPDHAVAVEPFLAERVEVLKGPSTLLYGTGAIGGVVDVHTGRIPHQRPQRLSGRAELRRADNGGETNAAFRLDGGGRVAWHLDAFHRRADEYDIPGFAESARLHAAEEAEEEAHHDEDEEHGEDEEAFGRLPGSGVEGSGGAIGVSWTGDDGFAGVSISTLRYDYGLPGGHGHHEDEERHEEGEHEEEEGNVTLDLEQTRIDFEAARRNPFAAFDSLNVRLGINDYEHAEIEPGGDIGTVFANESFEGRIELTENDGDGFDGVLGAQFGNRQFSAIGEEAFVPPVDTSSVAAFWLGERSFEDFDLEFGARLERIRHQAVAHDDADFTTLSASVGLVAPLDDALLGLHGGYSSRAPIAEELYSDGPHLASQSFELGDPGLDAERALNLAATLAWGGRRASLSATAYATSFRDYIYSFATGAMADGLPVMRYGQSDAVYRGIDLQGQLTLAEFSGGTLAATAMFDTVAAELDVSGNDRAPRLPPSRYGIGLEWQRQGLAASVDYMRVAEQDAPADFELPTDAYDDVRLYFGADLNAGAGDARVFLHVRNLTDAEQRHHSSYIKDLAPLPGRTVEAGLRWAF